MSHFYGVVSGQTRTVATRRGAKNGGLTTHAAGWRGAIRTEIYHDSKNERDMYRVTLQPWHGSGGSSRVLAEGILDASLSDDEQRAIRRAAA